MMRNREKPLDDACSTCTLIFEFFLRVRCVQTRRRAPAVDSGLVSATTGVCVFSLQTGVPIIVWGRCNARPSSRQIHCPLLVVRVLVLPKWIVIVFSEVLYSFM